MVVQKASGTGLIIMDWVACAQTYHKERKKKVHHRFRIYDLSLASRQMKRVDRTREYGCSGLPQREYVAKGVSRAISSAFQRTVLDFLDSN